MTPIAYYGTDISPNQTETQEGFLICRNVPISRTGDQEYLASELGLDGDPHRMITVHRYPEDVFDKAAVASFEGKPVTSPHPPEHVSPENYAAYTKGHVQNVRANGENVIADLYINDPVLASEIRNGVMREVSCGYACEYVEEGDGFKQTHIRGNHVAVVPQGRAGHEVAIKDAAAQAEKGRKGMADFMKSILRGFGTAAKNATPEEMAEMADAAAETIKALPDEKPKEEPTGDAADVKVESVPKGDDLGTKLDKVLELLGEVLNRDKKTSDEKDLDDLIEKLGEKEDPEAAQTVKAEEMGDKCGNDSALTLLKRVRPAVAQIEDKAVRASVVDALLATFGQENDTQKIMKAAQDNAAKAGKAANKAEEQRHAQQSAYDSRNPHKVKED